MTTEINITIDPCERFPRVLKLTLRGRYLTLRLLCPHSANVHQALVFDCRNVTDYSVMFDPPGIDEATLTDAGTHFALSRADGEKIVRELGVRGWTRQRDEYDSARPEPEIAVLPVLGTLNVDNPSDPKNRSW